MLSKSNQMEHPPSSSQSRHRLFPLKAQTHLTRVPPESEELALRPVPIKDAEVEAASARYVCGPDVVAHSPGRRHANAGKGKDGAPGAACGGKRAATALARAGAAGLEQAMRCRPSFQVSCQHDKLSYTSHKASFVASQAGDSLHVSASFSVLLRRPSCDKSRQTRSSARSHADRISPLGRAGWEA
jgi:hypothetical protein